MSAVTTQTFSISLTGVPASELDAEMINTLWEQSLGTPLNEARKQQNTNGVNDGDTPNFQGSRAIIYNKGAATMVRQRVWVTLPSAQSKATWLIENIPNVTPVTGPLPFEQGVYDGTISFTHVSTVTADGASLSEVGFITNP